MATRMYHPNLLPGTVDVDDAEVSRMVAYGWVALGAGAEPPAVKSSSSSVSQERRPPMRTPAAKTTFLIGAAGHAWTGGADDTTTKALGDRSYSATTNGAGAAKFLSSPTLGTPVDLSKVCPRVTFRVSDVTKLNQIAIQYNSSPADNASYGIPIDTLTSGDWITVTVPRSAFSTGAGAPTMASVTQMTIWFNDKSTGPVTVQHHGVDFVPDKAEVYPNGVFILEADDGYASQKNLLVPLAESLGVPVTLPLITERITSGAAGVTVADLQAMQRNGHQLSCHAHTSAFHGTGGTAAQWEVEFTAQQRWFDDNGLGWGGLDYSMCQGTGNFVGEGDKMDALRRRFRSVRQNGGYYQAAIPGDPHRLPSRLFTGDSNSILTGLIDKVTVGGAFTFAMHEAIAGSTNGTASGVAAMAVNNLKTVLQYAQGKGMAFRTRADYIAGR